jgi:hypothetical protein
MRTPGIGPRPGRGHHRHDRDKAAEHDDPQQPPAWPDDREDQRATGDLERVGADLHDGPADVRQDETDRPDHLSSLDRARVGPQVGVALDGERAVLGLRDDPVRDQPAWVGVGDDLVHGKGSGLRIDEDQITGVQCRRHRLRRDHVGLPAQADDPDREQHDAHRGAEQQPPDHDGTASRATAVPNSRFPRTSAYFGRYPGRLSKLAESLPARPACRPLPPAGLARYGYGTGCKRSPERAYLSGSA